MICSAKAFLAAALFGGLCMAQNPSGQTAAPEANKADAYYHFAMGRLYSEMAGPYGNQADSVNKAIRHYQDALKLEPTSKIIFEELTDLYIQTGRLQDAVSQAEDMLKRDPDNLDARRMLGRIYTRGIAGGSENRVNESMLRNALEQFKKVTEKDPKDAESWVTLGRLYRVSNSSLEAEKAYTAALAADPSNDDALTGLAMLYSDLGDLPKAIEKLKAAADKRPAPQTLATLAEAYERQRDYKNAAAAFRGALDLAPDETRIKASLARDLLYSEQLDEALKLYLEIGAEEPRDGESRLHVAEIYRAKRDLVKARDALAKAREIDGNDIAIDYEEVNLLDAEGKTGEATAKLKTLLETSARKNYTAGQASNRAMLLERLGLLYRSAGQYPQAVDTLRQIAALDADGAPRVAVLVVDTYRAAKDLETAQKEADAALKKFPNERMVRVAHAEVLSDRGKIDEAAAEVKALLKGDRDRETYLELAQIYEKGKRFPEMARALDSAEKLSESPDEKADVYFRRGAMFERMKKFDEAEAQFRKVLESSPDNSNALNYLGYMFADRGVRLEEANQLIQKALDLEPDNGAYLDSLGWVFYRQGKLKEAAEMLERAIGRIGTDPTVHDHLGDVYLKLGKTKEAITQWQASVKEFQTAGQSDADPEDVAKVSKKLENARVRLAKETK
jgi:tetratricopeptide (TPR) repeat protein